ncbi:MAG: hypothetical protein BTN85_1334 [Candidatus Methanohalarchaeum thermophilum]|uniref:Uncharacterized protein n=1 Tax=Methanohalarchaeum thermophilum TaxID=1903181 RepID=A0A1Q6DWT2_METT1|nr:MAG: hypothetical protein BTN85_1334 [Candidatus Methanohalarchaeum thermophilum]
MLLAYPSRNYLTTKSFFQKMMKKYGEKPRKAIVDRASIVQDH